MRRIDPGDQYGAQTPVPSPGRQACSILPRAGTGTNHLNVTGDDPTHIASGPCAPDPTTYADALAILDYYRINAPAAVMETLMAGAHGKLRETPKPGDAAFNQVENRIIANVAARCWRQKNTWERQGIPAVVLSDSITGESRDVAKVMAAIAREVRCMNSHGNRW